MVSVCVCVRESVCKRERQDIHVFMGDDYPAGDLEHLDGPPVACSDGLAILVLPLSVCDKIQQLLKDLEKKKK